MDSIATDESKLIEFIEAIRKSKDKSYELGILEVRAKENLKYLQAQIQASARNTDSRIADIEIGITNSSMKYGYDLNCFSERVKELFDWHNKNDVKGKYLALYFTLVQSSGMGKTKLTYEYKQHVNATNDKRKCLLILCEKSEKIGIKDEQIKILFSMKL